MFGKEEKTFKLLKKIEEQFERLDVIAHTKHHKDIGKTGLTLCGKLGELLIENRRKGENGT